MSFWNKVLAIYEDLETLSYYELLGVGDGASAQEIDELYFRIVRRLHPDRHARERDSRRLEALTRVYARLGEAHRVLVVPRLRGEYDAALTRGEVRLAGDHDVENRPVESDPKTDAGRKFLRLGIAFLEQGERKKARAQLELALQFEPQSKAIAEAVERLVAVEEERRKRLAGRGARRQKLPLSVDELLAELERVRRAAPHAILGITPTAEREVGRTAAQALIDTYHPKRFAADPQARELSLEIAKRVKQAYSDWREVRRELVATPVNRDASGGSVAAFPDEPGAPPEPAPAAPREPAPPPDSHLGRGLAFMAASNWLRAANSLQSATREDPRNAKVRGLYHVARGRQALRERRLADARTEFKNALMYDPNNEDAKRGLAD